MRATLPDGTVLQRSRNAALIAAILWPGMAARASAHLHPLAIAAGLGQAAEWPLPWRLSLDLLADPGVRWRVALALMAAGGGVASAVIGLCWRRGRLVLLLVCAGLLAAAAPTVRLLLVPAYPTSFFRSPTAFAAASILRGQAVFATHCATCHGAGARGDGPMAGQLPVRPADLTAAHIASHSDGDLFWWIGNGIKTDDGTQAM